MGSKYWLESSLIEFSASPNFTPNLDQISTFQVCTALGVNDTLLRTIVHATVYFTVSPFTTGVSYLPKIAEWANIHFLLASWCDSGIPWTGTFPAPSPGIDFSPTPEFLTFDKINFTNLWNDNHTSGTGFVPGYTVVGSLPGGKADSASRRANKSGGSRASQVHLTWAADTLLSTMPWNGTAGTAYKTAAGMMGYVRCLWESH